MSLINPRKILFLASSPKAKSQQRLEREVREIDEGLQRASARDQFELFQKWAVRPRDLQRAMLEVKPQIVHFSGHGAREEGLLFAGEGGQSTFVRGEALAELFALFPGQVECVVLNGCYAEIQAQAIAQQVPSVVGLQAVLGEEAAISFSRGFYDALGAGREVEFAYKLGCNAITMSGSSGHLRPVLIHDFVYDKPLTSISASQLKTFQTSGAPLVTTLTNLISPEESSINFRMGNGFGFDECFIKTNVIVFNGSSQNILIKDIEVRITKNTESWLTLERREKINKKEGGTLSTSFKVDPKENMMIVITYKGRGKLKEPIQLAGFFAQNRKLPAILECKAVVDGRVDTYTKEFEIDVSPLIEYYKDKWKSCCFPETTGIQKALSILD